MSREIKFRAWIEPSEYDEKKEMVYELAFKEYLPVNDQLMRVEHLMQYTGLQDKNGKDIYEGDMLKARHTIVPVVWTEWASFVACNPDDGEDYIVITDSSSFEVIGNIYENPELLKEDI